MLVLAVGVVLKTKLILGGGFCFLAVFLCFGGFKSQVKWPEGPPHLALNPPYVFLFVWFFRCVFCSFVFFGGFGSGEVARNATSPGPKPSLFVCFLCFFSCFCFLFSLK